jgi:hypothetical protein
MNLSPDLPAYRDHIEDLARTAAVAQSIAGLGKQFTPRRLPDSGEVLLAGGIQSG